LIGDLSIPLIEGSRIFLNVVIIKKDFMFVVGDYTPPIYDRRNFGCGKDPYPFSSNFIHIDSFFPFSSCYGTKSSRDIIE